MEDSNRDSFVHLYAHLKKLDVNPEFDLITEPIKIKMCETTYCEGCEFAYLCFGVDTEQCESYKERKRKAEEKNNNFT